MFFCARSSGCGCKRRQPKKKRLEEGWGEGAAPPPTCIGCSCIFWPGEKATLMFLCSVLMLFLEGVSLQEEATFKKTSWRGVGGEGAAPPPQMHWMSPARRHATTFKDSVPCHHCLGPNSCWDGFVDYVCFFLSLFCFVLFWLVGLFVCYYYFLLPLLLPDR